MSKGKIANYLIIILVLTAILAFFRHWYINKQLDGKKNETIAFVTDIDYGTGVRQIAGVSYNYYLHGKKYSGNDIGNFDFMKIGDTLLIEYAVSDNAVSHVKDKYYMKKYKSKKDENK